MTEAAGVVKDEGGVSKGETEIDRRWLLEGGCSGVVKDEGGVSKGETEIDQRWLLEGGRSACSSFKKKIGCSKGSKKVRCEN